MKNLIDLLSDQERQTIFECLCAAEQEIFFPEWEFFMLFGISREQLVSVRKKWPHVDVEDPDVRAAVIGSMGHLLGYPHGQHDNWSKYISVGYDVVHATADKVRELSPRREQF